MSIFICVKTLVVPKSFKQTHKQDIGHGISWFKNITFTVEPLEVKFLHFLQTIDKSSLFACTTKRTIFKCKARRKILDKEIFYHPSYI